MIAREQTVTGVRWSSVLAGYVTGATVYMVLAMLGLAVAGFGLGLDRLSEYGWGSILWLLFVSAVAAYIGGRTAAHATDGITSSRSGLYSGMLVGMLMLLTITALGYNALSSAVRTTFGAVSSVAQAGGQQISKIDLGQINPEQAANRIGLGEEYRNVMANMDRAQLEQEIQRAVPELSREQVSATVNGVMTSVDRARNEFTSSINGVSDVGPALQRQFEQLRTDLSGPQFVGTLQQQGLSEPQAREVSRVIDARVQELTNRGREAVAAVRDQVGQAVETTGDTLARAAWGWLLIAGLFIGLATLGGRHGSDEYGLDENLDQARYRDDPRTEARHH